MTNNRKLQILATMLIAAMILMAGTFAWQQMLHKVNEFIGYKTGIIVHDDFDPLTGAKDVYVENPNSAEVFIRVKLNEAMNLTSSVWRPGISDWKFHTHEDNANDCKHYGSAGQLFHSYFTWIMGGQKYYMPGNGSNPIVQDTNNYNGTEPGVKQTPYINPNSQIIKVATYLAMSDTQKDAFIGWICDVDGYAYWSQPLGKSQVTGLLLHKVETAPSLKGSDYYYAIDVIVEAVDIDDIPMWTQGVESVDGSGTKYQMATSQGKSVINYIKSLATPVESPIEEAAQEIDEILIIAETQEIETQDDETQDEETQDEETQDEETQDEETQDDETQDDETQDDETQDEEPQDEEKQDDETQDEKIQELEE